MSRRLVVFASAAAAAILGGCASPILVSANKGDVVGMRQVLGTKPNQYMLNSALENVALWTQENRVELARMLLEAGARPPKGCSAFKINAAALISQGKADLARVLVPAGLDPNCAPLSLQPAVVLAASVNDPALVRVLIDAGAQVDAKTTRNETALHWAAAKADPSVIQYLVEAGAPINHVGNGHTPLQVALLNGRPAAALKLIELGASPSATTGPMPLIMAVQRDDAELVGALLDAGAPVDALTAEGETALHWAALRARPAVIRRLTQAGASVRAYGVGHTPLAIAIANEREDAAEELITQGAPLVHSDMERAPISYCLSYTNRNWCPALVKRTGSVLKNSGQIFADIESEAFLGRPEPNLVLAVIHQLGTDGLSKNLDKATSHYRVVIENGWWNASAIQASLFTEMGRAEDARRVADQAARAGSPAATAWLRDQGFPTPQAVTTAVTAPTATPQAGSVASGLGSILEAAAWFAIGYLDAQVGGQGALAATVLADSQQSGPSPSGNRACKCVGYSGPGGPCYDGPGGWAYSGPGGAAYAGPGGPCYDGPGGPKYSGPGGAEYSGPGGPAYSGPGGFRYSGPGGPAYAGPGGACYPGPGGPCYAGPGGTGASCPAIC